MNRVVDTVSVSIVASGVLAALILVSTAGAGAAEQQSPTRVLVSPSSRAPTVTPSASAEPVRSAGSASVATTQPVAPSEKELLPLLDRVRALEADVAQLRAQLATQRREDAAGLSALRSQLATLRQEYDAHHHRLVSGCVSSQNIYPKSDLEGCVFVRLGPGATPPSTGVPVKYPQ